MRVTNGRVRRYLALAHLYAHACTLPCFLYAQAEGGGASCYVSMLVSVSVSATSDAKKVFLLHSVFMLGQDWAQKICKSSLQDCVLSTQHF